MPGSKTRPGCACACDDAHEHVAFRLWNSVGTQDKRSIVAQWLAYSHPCQRFAAPLTVRGA